jgi:hypothetical protein
MRRCSRHIAACRRSLFHWPYTRPRRVAPERRAGCKAVFVPGRHCAPSTVRARTHTRRGGGCNASVLRRRIVQHAGLFTRRVCAWRGHATTRLPPARHPRLSMHQPDFAPHNRFQTSSATAPAPAKTRRIVRLPFIAWPLSAPCAYLFLLPGARRHTHRERAAPAT